MSKLSLAAKNIRRTRSLCQGCTAVVGKIVDMFLFCFAVRSEEPVTRPAKRKNTPTGRSIHAGIEKQKGSYYDGLNPNSTVRTRCKQLFCWHALVAGSCELNSGMGIFGMTVFLFHFIDHTGSCFFPHDFVQAAGSTYKNYAEYSALCGRHFGARFGSYSLSWAWRCRDTRG